MRICKLCGKKRKLCQSHILPEFIYAPLYDGDNHTYNVIQANPTLRSQYQKGQWERLLCQECERKIGRWETYAKREWFEKRNSLNFNGNVCQLSIDYDKIKLFFLSILWRISISSRTPFTLIDLGEHEQVLRDLIFRCDPSRGKHYPFMIWWHERDGLLDNLISTPKLSRETNIAYVFLPLPQFLIVYEISDVISEMMDKGFSC